MIDNFRCMDVVKIVFIVYGFRKYFLKFLNVNVNFIESMRKFKLRVKRFVFN